MGTSTTGMLLRVPRPRPDGGGLRISPLRRSFLQSAPVTTNAFVLPAPADTSAQLGRGGRRSAPRAAWLSPLRCRLLLTAIVLLGFAGHLLYLGPHCPIDLAEDEAYYWDWSRQLDISYYSKGPLVPLLVRASCALVGDTPLGVRLPALVMGAGVCLMTYWLARRLFDSDRVALLAVCLYHAVPIFLVTRLVMTTDPPMLFCWAAATCLAAVVLFDADAPRRWPWLAIGALVGMGFLAKFSMPLWFLGLLLFLLSDRKSRPILATPWPWLGVMVSLLFTLPVIAWNAHHHWVTALHVGEDIGLDGDGALRWSNLADFWAGQIGVAGPLMFIVMIAAAAHALRRPRAAAAEHPARRATWFLASLGLTYFLSVFASSFRKNPSANWAAPSYFTLTVLAAHFLANASRAWRVLGCLAVAGGLALVAAAHDTELLYPAAARLFPARAAATDANPLSRRLDPTYRVHGWAEVGREIARRAAELRAADAAEPFILGQTYELTAESAFYMTGQPRTYCAGSYFDGRDVREPYSQYDMWPDRALEQPGLLGRDAVYAGVMTPDVRAAFARVDALPPVQVRRRGLPVRQVLLWRCTGFRGMHRPGWEGKYNK